MSVQNRHIWLERGILPPGIDRCEAAMPLFMEAIRLAGPELTDRVFAEARFQVEQLPRLTAQAQKKFGWKAPKAPKKRKT